jgi:hypothetical protein
MTEVEEEKEVKRIVDLLDARRDPRTDDELGRQLSYLTGDASTREKAKRYLTFDNRGNSALHLHMWYGLFIAQNRSLALRLVEMALRDLNRPATAELLNAATTLKNLLGPGTRERMEIGPTTLLEVADPRVTEISGAYVMELAAGLGKRSGENQTTTAITILTALPKGSESASAALREVRRILIQQFDSLHPISQNHLLLQYWEQLRDPALTPSLKKLMTVTGIAAKHLHEVALRRLLEVAPEEVRPYVIAATKGRIVTGNRCAFTRTDSCARTIRSARRRRVSTTESSSAGAVCYGEYLWIGVGVVPGDANKTTTGFTCRAARIPCQA